MSLKLISRPQMPAMNPDATIETIDLAERHVDFLEQMSHELNPAMSDAFGWPHTVRAILDRIAQSGVDLTAASS